MPCYLILTGHPVRLCFPSNTDAASHLEARVPPAFVYRTHLAFSTPAKAGGGRGVEGQGEGWWYAVLYAVVGNTVH